MPNGNGFSKAGIAAPGAQAKHFSFPRAVAAILAEWVILHAAQCCLLFDGPIVLFSPPQ
jgi:hypothetical protein